jgi:hypothetical protein
MRENIVKIHVVFRQGAGGPAGESPWAEPIDADEGGGTFRVQNDPMFTPLRHGDVVRCALDADSIYQVVEVVALMPGRLLTFEHPPRSDHLVVPEIDRLVAQGHSVNRPIDGLVEVLVNQKDEQARIALESHAQSLGWKLIESLSIFQRLNCIEQDVDFELKSTPVVATTPIDYWAADDEGWTKIGASEPATLAAIQTLATQDPRVLATIRAGRHADVMTFLERLSTTDPRGLPPLDRPLLVDPDARI